MTANQTTAAGKTDEELLSLTVPGTENPDWAVVSLTPQGEHPIELHAHTEDNADVLAAALNDGRLHGNPDNKHYVAVPNEKVSVIQRN